MKKKISFLMIFVLLMSLFPAFGLANPVKSQETQVYLNGIKINTGDVLPFIENGRTMVPVRLFSENLGATVKWDNTTQTVTIQSEDVSVKLTIGKKEAVVNGKNKTLDVTPMVISGRTMVPLRFIAEAFGADVKWDNTASKAVVTWNGNKGKSSASPTEKKKVTIIDSDGNKVTVNCPPKRVVAIGRGSWMAEIIKALKEESAVIGVDEETKKSKWPEFVTQLPSVGSAITPNLESIVSLKPDLVVGWYLEPQIREKIVQSGIPYVCVFYNFGNKLDKLPSNIRVVGKIFNREKLAEEYAVFIEKQWQIVKSRVENIPPEKRPKIYWEGASTPMGKDTGANFLITCAGGINIAGEEKVPNPKVSAEWVLQKNPDIIIKAVGSNLTGWDITDTEKLKQLREEIMSRPGFRETNAVKNGRVYIVSGPFIYGPQSAAGIYYLAKWFHPDLFKNVDPQAIHKEMLKKFYNEELRGIWVYPEN